MTGELPEDLPALVRDTARIMMEAARREGWTIDEFTHTGGRISIAANSPTGRGFYFSCEEDEFLDRLRAALLKR
ncbi:MAG TPA: hypothetical protein VFT60_06550 [Bryobacteraceae bacterium]|jgi:hypothetical protein|nr:hypothetical protein [Bryobacteraceae bacterium]